MKNKKLSFFLFKYWYLISLSLLLAILIVFLQLAIPFWIGESIDLIVGKNDVEFERISLNLIRISISIVLCAIAQFVMTNINNSLTFNISRDIRNEAMIKIEHLPLKYIDTHPFGAILSNVIGDVEQLSDGLLLGFSQLFSGVITILGTIGFMFVISWKIAIVVIVLSPLSLFVAKFIATKTHSMFLLQSKTRGEQTSFIEEMVNNQKVVQAFSHEDENEITFDEINERLYACSLKANFYSSTTNPSTRFINAIIYAIVCLIGAFNVIGGTISVGNMSTLLNYANQYTKPFNDISSVITELQNALACSSRIFELINQEEESDDSNGKVIDNPQGEFDIQNVYFSYNEEKPLIQDFSLKIKKGTVVALVGPTGCGKTTLINLLMRFYDVNDGSISLDGYNIQSLKRESLRSSIGMVLQETWLKKGTIRENIILGKEDATDEEIIKACKEAHSYHFIMQMKDGLNTMINEDGGNLSQGQKQLLCITRIMLCKPEILILDEATSSIDTRTEIRIQKAFNKLMENRTSFIVAHRLSTIQNADVILVMKDGNIIEKGNHNELLALNGFYKQLYFSQFEKN